MTIDEIEKQIRELVRKGQSVADETGQHFHAGGEEYIPASSPEYDDYEWARDDYGIPEGEGFWFSSSMSC
ncbi:hypothetical protein SHP1_025 [Salmonella phage SHP1]|uniref:Uncharacterized protein n=1 Tax=Escherichia phage AnYang TaxID=2499909 RepID=A0A410T4Z8_9CAUD|nr:hypothetical protein KNU29_gp069 [Escherichia phage AnYang]ASJ79347.1 hypothetical protein SHP1_025 [Salmonella phage SHP1]QAU03604.1 hypothetical protein [Escherichia phage AnYang]